ncbi:hypothetical protein [Clostridium merdae]|uniref:hypothetical protein n=1 Tax=Clostridium merdae TaxID=1958780 RepID=UPI000A266CFF|nr:hypothetical protein [Clostridium merdae]
MKILSIAADFGVMIGIRMIVTITEITIVIAIIVVAAMSVAVGAVMNAAGDVATDAVNVVLDNTKMGSRIVAALNFFKGRIAPLADWHGFSQLQYIVGLLLPLKT